jgi:hypothetical protein
MFDFIKKVLVGAIIWNLVRCWFRRPIIGTIIIVALYVGGRYMLFNHPETVSNGLRAVREETVAIGTQIAKVTVDSVEPKKTTVKSNEPEF